MTKRPPPPRPPTEVQAGDLPVWLEVWLETPPGKVLAGVLAGAFILMATAGLYALTGLIAGRL